MPVLSKSWLCRTIDLIGILGIGLYAFLSSVFASNFAEIHLDLSFLDFPVFVGEILLGALVILFLFKLCLTNGWQRWHLIWAAYFGWILIVAAIGYFQWGPLAFRNAALFYYVTFALLSYSFFNKRLMTDNVLASFVFLVLFGAVVYKVIGNYYWYTYVILILVLIHKKTPKSWHFVCFVILLLASHVESLFIGSRSHMVGIACAVLYLGILWLTSFCAFSLKQRWGVAIFLILLFIGGMLRCADHNAVKSLLNWEHIRDQHAQIRGYIDQRKAGFKFQDFPRELYHPNEALPTTGYSTPRSVQLKTEYRGHRTAVNDSPAKAAPVMTRPMPALERSERNTKASSVVGKQSAGETQPRVKTEPVENTVIPQTVGDIEPRQEEAPVDPSGRNLNIANNNILFRIFIWEDMCDEIKGLKFISGVGFGEAQRSKSLEILRWAHEEWSRDGWVAPHNFFLHVLYRAGVVGLFLILVFVGAIVYLTKVFVHRKDWCGVLLVSVLIYWWFQSLFSVTMELPYFAILFWGLFGMIAAYAFGKEENYERN